MKIFEFVDNKYPIENDVKMLCSARKSLSDVKQKIATVEQKVRDDNKEFYELESKLKKEISEYEDKVRIIGAELYDARENKNDKEICKGVNIKVYKEYNYEYGTAFNWALKNKNCLILDEKAFIAVCKSKKRPDFVKEIDNPKVTIATDLTVLYDEGLIS